MKLFFQTYLTSKWPTILWSAIIFILLAMPGSRFPNETWFSIMHLDKLVHAFLFFIFVWLWITCLNQKKETGVLQIVSVVFIAIGYGTAMEFIQIYTGRDFSVGDMLADGVGAFSGGVVKRWKKISPGGNRGRNQN